MNNVSSITINTFISGNYCAASIIIAAPAGFGLRFLRRG